MLYRSKSLRLSCFWGPLSFKFNLLFLCVWVCISERRRDDRWDSERQKGEIKREGGSITCYCMCYTKLILNCDGRRHLSEAVKVPMNHTALTPFPLSLYILLSLFIFLFFPLWDSACLCNSLSFCVCFSTVTCTCLGALSATWDVQGINEVHLSLFHIHTLFLPHAVLSLAVSLRLSVSLSGPCSLLGLITAVDVWLNKHMRPQ